MYVLMSLCCNGEICSQQLALRLSASPEGELLMLKERKTKSEQHEKKRKQK